MVLSKLKPTKLWNYFEAICNIPHISGQEKELIEYILSFAKEFKLVAKRDEIGNIVIYKAATPGYESHKTVVLQSHLDMVPQKNDDTIHDFLKDPIRPRIDGNWVKATGTTLGADNGIGVASILAVLASDDLVHGPIEALFTVQEETGLYGALALPDNFLKGDVLINLDSEDDGELFIGCSGGINTDILFYIEKEPVNPNALSFIIEVKGLLGGHSGVDILLGRGNAIKILVRLLAQAIDNDFITLASISGGSVRNAIPREARSIVYVDKNKVEAFLKLKDKFLNEVRDELRMIDAGISIIIKDAPQLTWNFTKPFQERLIKSLLGCLNGVIRMSPEIPGLVDTSSNIGSISTDIDNVHIVTLQRSLVDSLKYDTADAIKAIFELAGATVIAEGDYCGWEPDSTSEILSLTKEIHNKLFGNYPLVKAIHAGLECGIIGGKYPKMELISFGPTIKYPHSPGECVAIDTVERYWLLLTEVLKHL